MHAPGDDKETHICCMAGGLMDKKASGIEAN